jgi:hypothetical protein
MFQTQLPASPLSDGQRGLLGCAVTDFKVADFGVNFGVGSDRWAIKTTVGYAFPVPGGRPDAGEPTAAGPVNPMAHASVRFLQP